MAKGMRVNNRPKTAAKRNLQKLGRIKKQQRKNQKPKSKLPLVATGTAISQELLRINRTNPQANKTLSGKKQRLLAKKRGKNETVASKMEVMVEKSKRTTRQKEKNTTVAMDTD